MKTQLNIGKFLRHISWDIEISDGNGISDIMSMRIELGDDSDFGITYDVADSICSVMDTELILIEPLAAIHMSGMT